MITALTSAAAVSGLFAIAADWHERRHRSFYLLKPLTTVLILVIAALAPAESAIYRHWIVAGLLLSLAGDISLMFTHAGKRWFMAGLGAFLLAHLAFVAAFSQGIRVPQLPGWLALVAFYAAALLFVLLPRAGHLKIPVLLYGLVLAAMVFAAAARYEAAPGAPSLYALLGALLFLLSDSLLGIRRFIAAYRYAQALILSTYWAAIGLIAWSV